MDCTLSNESQRKEAEHLGLDYAKLYKRGLERAAADYFTGIAAETYCQELR
jgi:hypothetical protein